MLKTSELFASLVLAMEIMNLDLEKYKIILPNLEETLFMIEGYIKISFSLKVLS